jgi:endonuclease/exonuclease/phosphatase family metal-dependent hydrolase
MNMCETINIMTMNTWLGTEAVKDGINKLVRAVELSGADIVGFQEWPDPGKKAAEKLGWYYHQNAKGDKNGSIISKYPIVEAYDLDGVDAVTTKIQLPFGREIIVTNAHLYFDPYGPYWALFDKKPTEDIIAMEKERRGNEISIVLEELSAHLGTLPVFLMGDFNTPSHLDWDEDVKDRHNERVVDWPVSILVEKAGLIDSYRAIHPDPVASPGYTWSPVHTPEHPWGENPYEPQDRIDFIYFYGDVKVVSSEVFVVGKPQGFGNHENNEWPSDHAAVISTFHFY